MGYESSQAGSTQRPAQLQPVGENPRSQVLGDTHVSKYLHCQETKPVEMFRRYENFRTIIYVNQFPYFKGSQDKNPRVLLINLYGNHCWYTASARKSQPKPTVQQTNSRHLSRTHKMGMFFKCFPRCLNCTRKLIGSGTTPTSNCRTRFRCQNSFTSKQYLKEVRGTFLQPGQEN